MEAMDHTDPPPEKQSQAGWTRVDNAILPVLAKIGQGAIGVYVALKSYADADGVCWPSVSMIAQRCGASKSTAERFLRQIIAQGLVQRERRNLGTGRISNLYRFPTVILTDGVEAQPSESTTPTVKSDMTPTVNMTEEQEPVSEQEPKNKNQLYSHCNAQLVGLISAWNEIAPTIGAPAVHSDPPSKAVLASWKRLSKDRELREAFADVPAIMSAVRKAKFCHRQGWFTLPWLFTTDPKTRELRVHKLLNGAYDVNGSIKQRSSGYGPGQVFDPNSEPQGGRVTDF